jgi:uncharacterized small protein (DUF1192 family)
MGRPPIGKRAMSGSERQRRYLDRLLQTAQGDDALKAANAALKIEIEKLKAQAKAGGDGNATLKAKCTALEQEIAALKAELHDTLGTRFAPRERKPKVEKLPLPPDEVRERRIKALTTEVRNLKAQIRYITIMHGATFTPELEKNIRVCLHPDWVPDPKQKRRYEKTLADFNAVMDATKAKQKGRAR